MHAAEIVFAVAWPGLRRLGPARRDATVTPGRDRHVLRRARSVARMAAMALVLSPPNPHYSREAIRIHPERIISWGLDEG